jgi:hypothetical protein
LTKPCLCRDFRRFHNPERCGGRAPPFVQGGCPVPGVIDIRRIGHRRHHQLDAVQLVFFPPEAGRATSPISAVIFRDGILDGRATIFFGYATDRKVTVCLHY